MHSRYRQLYSVVHLCIIQSIKKQIAEGIIQMGQIVTKEQFSAIRTELVRNGKRIVQCHGVFDLVHPGHLAHFQEAKKLGDCLVVSVTMAEFVRKGPDRPYFNDEMRLNFLAALECIDYVLLSEGYTGEDVIEAVKPDVWVKGSEYINSCSDVTGAQDGEVALVQKYGGTVHFTSGPVFSSSRLINNALPSLTDEVKDYISNLCTCHNFESVKMYLEKLTDLKVLVVGDVIIDEYIYCDTPGQMTKAMGYSTRICKRERFLGGALAVARHASSFSDNVTIASVIGVEEELNSQITNEIEQNIKLELIKSPFFSTIVKTKYLVENEKREELDKIFSVSNLASPMIIHESIMKDFEDLLKQEINNYDLVIVCDFGHGLITDSIIKIIEEKSKKVAINCQTNSANYGVNLITKYKNMDSFTLDQKELKLACTNESLSENEKLNLLAQKLNSKGWLTQGSKGALGIEKGVIVHCPALTLRVKDTIGAGDAFFVLASLLACVKTPLELSTFLASIAGALATNIVGNKEKVDKRNVLKFSSTLMNL